MRIIHTVRYIRNQPIPRLDLEAQSSGNSGTNHTHANKAFLDNLGIDVEERLTYEHDVIPVPVIEEDW